MKLMINDYIRLNSGEEGKVVSLEAAGGSIKTNDGKEYWFYSTNWMPLELTEDWIIQHRVFPITLANGVDVDFSRSHKLKVSLFDSNQRIQISYFFPKPKYVHELQQILRGFSEIEL